MSRTTYGILAAISAHTLSFCSCVSSDGTPDPQLEKPDYESTILAIAHDIEGLRGAFPQLERFSAGEDCDLERLVIQYDYKTHTARHRGGWTSGVPNPDEDGVWFYIDFHEPGSTAQIHTQPRVPDMRLGDKRVILLVLEGARTNKISAKLQKILRKHGVK